MDFCFSFEVLIKLNPIQANVKGGGSSNKNNQGGGMKIRTITSQFLEVTDFIGSTCHTTSQLKTCRNK